MLASEKDLERIVIDIVEANDADMEIADSIIGTYSLENKLLELGDLDKFCDWVGQFC